MKRTWALFFAFALFTIGMLIPPIGFSQSPLAVDQECEECHSEFEPFLVVIDAPSEVPNEYDFDYNVIIRNNGDHQVQGLEAIIDLSQAEFLETSLAGGDPYHEEIASSVSVMETATITFPVTRGARQATIILDGDAGRSGLNDLDMVVRGPEGDETSSANSGADEAVLLRERDIRSWGYGDYEVDVIWFLGSPTISYTLTIDVEYGVDQIHMEGEDLAPGEEYIFVLPLSSTAKGDNIINVAVTGTVFYDHQEDDPIYVNSDVYTIGESSDLKVGTKFVYSEPNIAEGGSINVLLIERALGLLSAIGLIVSLVFSGILKPFALKIEKFVGGGAQRVKLHCRSSQGVMFLSLIHGMLLPFSPHASSLRGLVLGVPLFIIMGLLGYIGWKQNILRPRWGNERWKRIHLILSILAVAIVISHAVLDGTEFAWLR